MIKVLFLGANPKNTTRLRLDEEVQQIDQALAEARFGRRFNILQHWAVRVTDLQKLLQRHQPNIVHFSGHGSTDSEIVLEGPDGTSCAVPADALSELFGLLRGNIRCVVLNACYSEDQARAIGQHIDCVVGMSSTVTDEAAIAFSRAFYGALGCGADIQKAFALGCNQIHLQKLTEKETPRIFAKGDPSLVVLVPSATGRGSASAALAVAVRMSNVVVGQPPPLAPAYQTRRNDRDRITKPWTDSGPSANGGSGTGLVCQVLAGDGGVGKSQLAAGIFSDAAADTSLRVWVSASTEESLLSGYAAAAARVRSAGADDPDLLARAKGFLKWLTENGSGRSWLIVLDDLALDPKRMQEWWPPTTPHGRVLVTTRRQDAAYDGFCRDKIKLGVYTPAEARDYLSERLSRHQGIEIPDEAVEEAEELAKDLGYLPVGLAQAAAVIIDTGSTCKEYRERFADRTMRLTELLPPSATAEGKTVASTWSVAIEAADALVPVGLARRAACLASVIDPGGSPVQLWTAPAARAYLAAHRTSKSETAPVAVEDAKDALRALARFSLVTIAPAPDPAGVRIHPLAQRAILDPLTADELSEVVNVVADALVEIWPSVENNPDLSMALRANTAHLTTMDPDALWRAGRGKAHAATPDDHEDEHRPGAHPVLFKAGNSLGQVGLVTQAHTYFEQLVAKAGVMLGPAAHDTLGARYQRARWLGETGKPAEAAECYYELLKEQERILGADDPNTLNTRTYLARANGMAGNAKGAVAALEKVLEDRLKQQESDHPDVLSTRGNLAFWQGEAGDPDGAAKGYAELLADREKVLGLHHPATLRTRSNLFYWQGMAGRAANARDALKCVVVDQAQELGLNHPDTLVARHNHACLQGVAGDPRGAVKALREVLDARLSVLGSDHPDTLTTRHELARWLGERGHPNHAVEALGMVLKDRLRVLGPKNPDTLATRGELARWLGEAGQYEEAVTRYSELLTDQEGWLGPDNPHTISTRTYLARAQGMVGDAKGAVHALQQVVHLAQDELPKNHPITLSARGNLAYWQGMGEGGNLTVAADACVRVLDDRNQVPGLLT